MKEKMRHRNRRRAHTTKVADRESNAAAIHTSGVLEILPEGYGFLRHPASLERAPDDTYVSRKTIERWQLETGVLVTGTAFATLDQNAPRLERIELLDGEVPGDARPTPAFEKLRPIQPRARFQLSRDPDLLTRAIDLLVPIGKGQRGLIVAPPRTGKTMLLQKLSQAFLNNHPECHVQVLLVDERPEEVTDFEESLLGPQCQVYASTFDQPASNHVRLTRLVLQRAKRAVVRGKDVVLLLDSLTRLTRAHNTLVPATCKLTTGGIAMEAIEAAKSLFGAARQIRGGGSLTILATALVDTGSRMDEFIFEEFKGTGNMDLHLSRDLAEQRIWPALDVRKSGTRREELLRTTDEQKQLTMLRRALQSASPNEGLTKLLQALTRTRSNEEFLDTFPASST